jgi:hypothetical protein
MNFEKIKELWKNKYTKPLLFFGFYIIFFIFLFAVSSPVDSTIVDEDKKNAWDNINNNYEYLYTIEFSDNNIITLEGKKFGNKCLYDKKINDVFDSQIYTFYDEVSKKIDNTWTSINDLVIVSDNFDNNLLDIKYIKDLILDSELTNSTTNFDGSKNETYQFSNIKISVTSEESVLKKIVLFHPLYKVTLQYRNINKVKDFVVEK